MNSLSRTTAPALVLSAGILSLAIARAAAAQPRWEPGFNTPTGQGLNDTVQALATFDDGSGEALFVGGWFTQANGGPQLARIARWSGFTWSPLGTGMDFLVYALAFFDDGNGPALYAAGEFTIAGGVPANRIARWDGSNWSALGVGLNNAVYSLVVFDDGSGPALFAAGSFTLAGGAPADRVAKWDGKAWSPLGSGLSGQFTAAYAMAVYSDQGGPALYVGGNINEAGGVPAANIARWDGSRWSAVGSGLNEYVQSLTTFDDGSGSGPALYAGGNFTMAGAVPASRVARWDGAAWSPLGAGVNDGVFTLGVHEDAEGPALVAGGYFTMAGGTPASFIARWNGLTWAAFGAGMGPPGTAVYAIGHYDGRMVAGGLFLNAAGAPRTRIASWDGAAWKPFSNGFGALMTSRFPSNVELLPSVSDELLYVRSEGNSTFSDGGQSSSRLAAWTGSSWQLFGPGPLYPPNDIALYDDGLGPSPTLYTAGTSFPGLWRWTGAAWQVAGTGTSGPVNALAVYDAGSGAALYAGGSFFLAGGVLVNNIARWDGSAWSSLGPPGSGRADGPVHALAVYNDGSGDRLYVGGAFTFVNDEPISYLAAWDGFQWFDLGDGGVNGPVTSLDVIDDGTGPALYVRGTFSTAGGGPARNIARWFFGTWDTLDGGVSAPSEAVHALAVYPDPFGYRLYATGSFTLMGGVAAGRIARWNGDSWQPLGNFGLNDAGRALAVFDDNTGEGPALYVGGDFTVAGGLACRRVARWNGMQWSPLDIGINTYSGGSYNGSATVNALAVFDGGTGPALYVSGSFDRAGTTISSSFARWSRVPPTCPADCAGTGQVVDVTDLLALLSQWNTAGACDATGNDYVDVADLLALLAAWGDCPE
jgi:hypothetical protein